MVDGLTGPDVTKTNNRRQRHGDNNEQGKDTHSVCVHPRSRQPPAYGLQDGDCNDADPGLNLDDLDPDCSGIQLLQRPLARRARVVLNNNFAFGGINTSLVLGNAVILKLFRRLVAGVHPEAEMGSLLTARGYTNIATLLGEIQRVDSAGVPTSFGVLQRFIHNQGDAWAWVQAVLQRATAVLNWNPPSIASVTLWMNWWVLRRRSRFLPLSCVGMAAPAGATFWRFSCTSVQSRFRVRQAPLMPDSLQTCMRSGGASESMYSRAVSAP